MATVLIIEDEAALLEEMIMMMRFEGFEAVGALTGEDGVRLARDLLPDIIVSDIMLPGLDGYGVLQALQRDAATEHIPFIFLTAKSSHAHVREGMTLGADDYITKPFTRGELLEAIQTRLAERETVARVYQDKFDSLRESLTLTLPHEFRTPLTSLVGFAELLVTDSRNLDARQIGEMANMILMSGERLRRHLENSWLYAQLEALKAAPEYVGPLQQDRLDQPAEVIAAVVQRLARRANRVADVTLRLIDASLALTQDNLAKIVEELLDNALKFSTPGEPVKIDAFPSENAYTLRVTDHGRGMTPEQIKEAGAYVQFDRTFFEQQGVGLGLTLVRGIVHLQDGELAIVSEAGQGTQVTVTLPLIGTDAPLTGGRT